MVNYFLILYKYIEDPVQIPVNCIFFLPKIVFFLFLNFCRQDNTYIILSSSPCNDGKNSSFQYVPNTKTYNFRRRCVQLRRKSLTTATVSPEKLRQIELTGSRHPEPGITEKSHVTLLTQYEETLIDLSPRLKLLLLWKQWAVCLQKKTKKQRSYWAFAGHDCSPLRYLWSPWIRDYNNVVLNGFRVRV